jgi:chemotaxis family two-component system sensor kinase Cph1
VTQYLEEWADRSGLHIDLEIKLGDQRLPQAIETAMFRVLQETITNVVKHSGANRVGVVLDADDVGVRLIVEDNGCGLQQGSEDLALGIGHLGLLGLRERLALAGGSVEVESNPQNGTTVYARIPFVSTA